MPKNQKFLQRYEFFFKKTLSYKKKVVILQPISRENSQNWSKKVRFLSSVG